LQARFHFDPDKAHAAALARAKADADNRQALSGERNQAEQLRAAKDAKYEADQAAARAAFASNNAPSPNVLPVEDFSLTPPADPNHHTIYDATHPGRLIPQPAPDHLTQHQAFPTNDPDMPVMPQ
jgi:hypothetical protein